MAKRRSARVRNTKSKKEEKIDFQELLLKFLPPRYSCAFNTALMFSVDVCMLDGIVIHFRVVSLVGYMRVSLGQAEEV